jgi:hypothetical protein
MLAFAATGHPRFGARQRVAHGDADTQGTSDVVRCAAATHKLSRLLTKDPVTSPLRAPFASYEGTSGPAELREEARGEGGRKTVGELVTCPFCASVWVATGFTAGLLFFPARPGWLPPP